MATLNIPVSVLIHLDASELAPLLNVAQDSEQTTEVMEFAAQVRNILNAMAATDEGLAKAVSGHDQEAWMEALHQDISRIVSARKETT